MNKIYKVIFNHATGVFQAVSELARSHVKSSCDERKEGGVVSPKSKLPKLSALALAIAMSSVVATNAGAVVISTDGSGNSSSIWWNNGAAMTNVGSGVSIGAKATIGQNYATALGAESNAAGNSAVAIGRNSKSNTAGAEVLGRAAYNQYLIENRINRGDIGKPGFETHKTAADEAKSTAVAKGDGTPGMYAVAIGFGAIATNSNAVALGKDAGSAGNGAVAIGSDAAASAQKAVAMGGEALARGNMSVAIGDRAWAENVHSFALGGQSTSKGSYAVAIGSNTQALSNHATAVGKSAHVGSDAEYGLALGAESVSTANNATSIAKGAFAGAQAATAIGKDSRATGEKSLAMGDATYAYTDLSTAIGATATVSGANSTAIGNSAFAGSADEAVTKEKLDAAYQAAYADKYKQLEDKYLADYNITDKSKIAQVLKDTANAEAHKAGQQAVAGLLSGKTIENALAFGTSAKALATSTIAIGTSTQASGDRSTAIGGSAQAKGVRDTIIGYNARSAYTVGGGATMSNTAVGDNTYLGANVTEGGLVLGSSASGGAFLEKVGNVNNKEVTEQHHLTNILRENTMKVSQTVAIGSRATAYGDQSSALSSDSWAIGNASISIGGDDSLWALKQIAKDIDVGTETERDAIKNATTKPQINKNSGNIYRSIAGATDLPNMDVYTQAATLRNSIVFTPTTALGDASLALGTHSQAGGAGSIATGLNAIAYGTASNAIGLFATAGADRINAAKFAADAAAGASALAIGTYANATAKNANAIGYRSTATAVNATAIGSSSNATGNQSIAIGHNANASGTQSISIGTGNQVSGNHSGAFGDPNNVTGNESYAFGNNNTISGNKTFVLGNNVSDVTTNRSVILGDNSAAGSVTGTNTATVTTNQGTTVTYSGFAGSTLKDNNAGSYVSVGAKNDERKIINLAAGNISDTSTEAINGSQLYQVLSNGVFTVYNTTTAESAKVNDVGFGSKLVFANGTNTTVSVEKSTDGSTTTVKYDVNLPEGGSSSNVETAGIAWEDSTTGGLSAGVAGGATNNKKLVTVEDVVNAFNKVAFAVTTDRVAGSNGINTGKTTFDMQLQSVALTLSAGENIRIDQENNVIKFSTPKEKRANITAVSNGTVDVDPDSIPKMPESLVDMQDAIKNNDVGEAAESVVEYYTDIGKTNTVYNGDLTASDGSVLKGKTVAELAQIMKDRTLPANTRTAARNALNEMGQAAAAEIQTEINQTGDDILVNVTTVVNAINSAGFTLKADAVTDTNGKNDTADGTLKTDGELIKAGSTVTMKAGKNMVVKHEADGNITYGTADDVEFTSVNATTFTVGTPATTATDSKQPVTLKTEDATDANVNPTANTPTTALNISSTDSKPTQLKGVGSVLNTTTIANTQHGTDTAPDTLVNIPTNDQNILNSAATVADIAKLGWVVSSDKTTGANGATDTAYKDTVTNAQEVKFVGKNQAVVSGETDASGVRTITVDVKVPEVETVGLSNTGGKVTEPNKTAPTTGGTADGDKFVNATTVANAINQSGFTLKTSAVLDKGEKATDGTADADGELIKAGETVEIIAGDNIAVKQDTNGQITLSTTKDIKQSNVTATNSVVIGDTANDFAPVTLKTEKATPATVNPTDNTPTTALNVSTLVPSTDGTTTTATPTQITGVGSSLNTTTVATNAGTPTGGTKPQDVNSNLVNLAGTTENPANPNAVATVGDLQNMGWVVKATGNDYANTVKNAEEVNFVAGSSKVSVTGKDVTENGKTVRTITVDVNIPDVELNKTNLTVEDGKVKNVAAGDEDKLVNATTVAKAINESGWKTTLTPTTEGGTATTETINPSDSVNFVNGTGTTANVAKKGDAVEVKFDVAKAADPTATAAGQTDAGKLTNTTAGDVFLTSNQVVDAINKAGFTLKSNVTGSGERTTGTETSNASLITAGKTVEIVAGDNIAIKHDEDGKITLATKKDIKQDNVTAANSVTIGGADNNPTTKLTTDPNTGDLKVEDQNGNAVSITNVKEGLETYAGDTTLTKVGDNYYKSGDVVDGKPKENAEVYTKVGDNYYNVNDVTTADLTPTTTADSLEKVGDNYYNKSDVTNGTVNTGATPVYTQNQDGSYRKEGDADTSYTVVNGNVYPTDSLTNNVANATPFVKGDSAYNQIANLDSSNGSNVMTVADAAKLGWVVSSDKTTGDLAKAYEAPVQNANEVKFVGTGVATVSGKTEGDIRTITVNVDAQEVINKAQQPVVYTTANGDKVYKVGDKFYKADQLENGQPKADAVATPKDQVIASMNTSESNTTTPMTLADVKGTLNRVDNNNTGVTTPSNTTLNSDGTAVATDGTATTTAVTKAPISAEELTKLQNNEGNVLNHAATVGDVINAGWNLQGNGEAKDFVRHADTVNFVNGAGTTATVETNENGTVSNITYNVNVDNTTTAIQEVTADGKPVVKDETDGKYYLAKADGTADKDQPEVNASDVKSQVVAKTTDLKPQTNGSVNVDPQGSGDNLVNATTVANAINNAGFTLKTSKTDGTRTADTDVENGELITAGDVVEVVAGKNITVNQTKDGKITISTENASEFDSVKVGKDDNVVNFTTTAATPANVTTTAPTTALNISSDGKPTQITGVGSVLNTQNIDVLPVATDGTPTTTQLINIPANASDSVLNSAATVGDLAKMGFVVSSNRASIDKLKDYKDTVTNAQELRFVGTGLAVVSGETTADGVRTITVDVQSEIKVGDVVVNDDGSVTKQALTEGEKAILKKGEPDPTSAEYSSNDADSSLVGEKHPDYIEAKKFYEEAKAKNNVNRLVSEKTLIDTVNNSGWNTKLSDGSTELINPSDYVNFVDGAGTTANVTKDGSNVSVTFDVNKVATAPTASTVANATTDKPAGKLTIADADKGDKFLTAEEVVNAVNSVGFVLKTSTAASGERVDGSITDPAKGELISAGNTVEIVAGDNLAIQQDENGKITLATKKDIKQDNVTAANSVTIGGEGKPETKLTTDPNTGDLKVEDQNGNAVSITNVKEGLETYAGDTTLTKVGDNYYKSEDVVNGTPKADAEVYTKVGDNYYKAGDVTNNLTADNQDSLVKVGDNYYNKSDVTDGTVNTGATPVYTQNQDGSYSKAGDTTNTPYTVVNGNLYPTDSLTNNVAKATPFVEGNSAYNQIANLDSSNGSNVMTVADAAKLGWVVSADKSTDDLAKRYEAPVQNANEVKFVGKGLAVVSGQTDADGVRVITVDVDAQDVVEKSQRPVVYTTEDGTKVTLVNGEFVRELTQDEKDAVEAKVQETVTKPTDPTAPNYNTELEAYNNALNNALAEAAKVANGDVIASMNTGDRSTTDPMTLADVKGTLNRVDNANTGVENPVGTAVNANGTTVANGETATTTPVKAAPITADALKALQNNEGNVLNHAATVGDVINAGWNLQGNGEAKDFVRHADTVNFVDGQGTTASVKTDDKGEVSTITYNVNVDNTTTAIQEVNADGKPVVKDADGKYYLAKADGTADKSQPAVNASDVKQAVVAKTTDLTVSDAPTAENANTPKGKVVAPVTENAGNLVNATTVANAINNAGWTTKATDGTDVVVNPGDRVDYVDGKGTKANVTVEKDANGKETVKVAYDLNGKDGVGTTFKQNDDGSFQIDIKEGDVASGDNNFVTGDTVNTAIKNARTIVTSDDGSIDVTMDETAAGGYVFDVSVNTGDISPKDNGSVTGPLAAEQAAVTAAQKALNDLPADATPAQRQDAQDALTAAQNALALAGNPVATAQNVADAINASGWNTTLSDGTNAQINPGDRVDYVNGKGTTANTVADANGNVNVSYNVNVDNVTTEIKEVVEHFDASGNKLAAGTDGKYYAINADGTVGTTAVTPAKTVTTTQVVAKTAELKPQPNGSVKIDPQGNGDSLVNASTVENAINNSGWNVNSKAVEGSTGKVTGTTENTLVKPGTTVNINAGNNIEITRNGQDVAIATSMTPTFNSVQVGGSTGSVIGSTADGDVRIAKADGSAARITNVAPGEISATSTDAINGSQLYSALSNYDANINMRLGDVYNKLGDVDKDLRAGIAATTAMVNIPQVTRPGANMLGLGAGHYKGQSAIAIGFSSASDNERVIFKLSGGANTRGEYNIGSGVGIQW